MFDPSYSRRADDALRKFAEDVAKTDPRFAKFANAVALFACRSGGRMRPVLCLLAGEAFDCAVPSALDRLAVGLELLHAMALIHDDLIDHAGQRRGEPTLHRVLAQLDNDSDGTDLALLAGDWLLLHALGMIADAPLDTERRLRITRLTLHESKLAAEGATRELLLTGLSPTKYHRQDIIDMYQLKTAEYSVVCPLLVGAIAGKADDDAQNALAQAGAALGIAYQIRDDLEELRTSQNEDLALRRPTLLLWNARHLLTMNDARRIDDYVQTAMPDREICAEILALTGATVVVETVQADIDRYCDKAMEHLAHPRIPKQLASDLNRVAKRLRKPRHIHGTTAIPPDA